MFTKLEILLEMKRQLDETILKVEEIHKNPKNLSKNITFEVNNQPFEIKQKASIEEFENDLITKMMWGTQNNTEPTTFLNLIKLLKF